MIRARRSAAQTIALAIVLIVCAAASLLAAHGAKGILGTLLAALMIAIDVTDARRWIIPDELSAAAFVLGVLHAALTAQDTMWQAMAFALLRALIAAMLFYGILVGYRMLRGHDGLGLGDVKLAAVAGVWLDWLGIAAAVEMAALSALAAYLAVSLFAGRKMRRTAALPLGLFLAPSIWLAWLGETVLLR